ncbi:MAG: TolC family protein [Planctomycetota bacterium]
MAIADAPIGPLAAPTGDLLAGEPADAADARFAQHPDARAVELKRERIGTMAELIETMSRPDADLDLSELPDPLADRPAFREMPAAMPPGPWYGLMEARRAELAHRGAALEAARTALIDQLRARAITAGQDLDAARAELQLQATLDGLARQAVDATTEAFRAGRVDVDRVLAALTQRLDSALGASTARRDIATALADSDYLLGPR